MTRCATISIVTPASCSSLEDARRRISRPAFGGAIDSCARYVKDRFGMDISDAPGHIAGGIRVNAANRRTVTVHPGTARFVGLHVDNWTRLPLNQRHTAPRRICINLGNEARYFLFVNLSYIAPTENIIHDGSSVGARGHDVSLSLREGPWE